MDQSVSLALAASIRPVLISCLWTSVFLLLAAWAAQSFRRALLQKGPRHPLLSLVIGTLVVVGAALVWSCVQPDLRWGAVVIVGPVVAAVISTMKPRPRRWRSRA